MFVQVLLMTKTRQTFRFTGIREDCQLSLFRGFSAPVNLVYELNSQQLDFILQYDSDEFNKWKALQTLSTKAILERAAYAASGVSAATFPPLEQTLLRGYQKVILDANMDYELKVRTTRRLWEAFQVFLFRKGGFS